MALPTFTAGRRLRASELAAIVSEISTDWAAFTPTWTSSGTAPSLGDGTIIGRAKKIGRVVHWMIRLTWGGTTTGGTGSWAFGNLPDDRALSNLMGHGGAFDTSATLTYPVAVQLSASGTADIMRVGAHTSAGAIGSAAAAHPFTWASGDILTLQGTYQSAS